jgi:hypothetical protein
MTVHEQHVPSDSRRSLWRKNERQSESAAKVAMWAGGSQTQLAVTNAGSHTGSGIRLVGGSGMAVLDSMDLKLEGLDKKIERIAGVVGARTGPGVSQMAVG